MALERELMMKTWASTRQNAADFLSSDLFTFRSPIVKKKTSRKRLNDLADGVKTGQLKEKYLSVSPRALLCSMALNGSSLFRFQSRIHHEPIRNDYNLLRNGSDRYVEKNEYLTVWNILFSWPAQQATFLHIKNKPTLPKWTRYCFISFNGLTGRSSASSAQLSRHICGV